MQNLEPGEPIGSWKAENLGALSIQNERKTLQYIKNACVDALKLYPSTL